MATACTGESDDGGNGSDGDSPPDQVTYLTSFGMLGRDAYAVVAMEKGFFEEANIEVDIQPGAGTPNLAQLAGGEVQFAASDVSGAIIQRGEGASGFTAIAAIHQQSPAALMTSDPDIRGPQDLADKTVYMANGAILQLLFPVYAEAAGLDAAAVEVVPVDPPNLIPSLAAGDADVIEQFAMGVPSVEAAVGEAVTVLPYSDYLRDLYGVALFTTETLAEENPDLCVRFRDALLRGLEYALANPEEAGQILSDFNPEGPPAEVNAQELTLMQPYVEPLDPGSALGSMDSERVTKSIAILQSANAVPEGIVSDDIVTFSLAPGSQ